MREPRRAGIFGAMRNPGIERALRRYVSRGYRRVDGWLDRDAVRIIRDVAAIQDDQGVEGSVAEIGIHHGKLFILLHLLASPGGKGYAFDLFDMQAENTDRSGRGDLERFERNLDRHGCPRDEIEVHAVNSLELTVEDVSRQISPPVRLFSVDGGHSAENTSHDLSLAAAVMCEGGVVIVDDYFKEDWPGVSEGVMRFLIARSDALFPFVIGGNKILLTGDRDRAEGYRQALIRAWKPWEYKHSEFLGCPVLILSRHDRLVRRLKHSALGSRLRDSRIAERIRRWQRRLLGS